MDTKCGNDTPDTAKRRRRGRPERQRERERLERSRAFIRRNARFDPRRRDVSGVDNDERRKPIAKRTRNGKVRRQGGIRQRKGEPEGIGETRLSCGKRRAPATPSLTAVNGRSLRRNTARERERRQAPWKEQEATPDGWRQRHEGKGKERKAEGKQRKTEREREREIEERERKRRYLYYSKRSDR